MTNELLEKPVVYEVNGEEVKLSGSIIKQYILRGSGAVTDQELVMFLQLAKFQKLNPFLNEAYLVKFGSQPAQIIVSKEAFMKRAENHPEYDGFEAGIVVQRGEEIKELPGAIKLPKDILIGGWANVYRKDRRRPVVAQVALEEFSKGQATWKNMPNTMIRKTAIVNALREAFPETLGAMYTEDDKNPSIKYTETVTEVKEETTSSLEEQFKEAKQAEAIPEHTEVITNSLPEEVPDFSREEGIEDDDQQNLFGNKEGYAF